MIIHLNGWPGVGKLTVGRALADLLKARLIDNHTVQNLAAALSSRDSPAYWGLRLELQNLAFAHIRATPREEVYVLTNALEQEEPRAWEIWDSVKRLAQDRADTLIAVILDCSLAANIERVAAPERAGYRKLDDPAALRDLRSKLRVLDTTTDADFGFRLDTTDLFPQEAAERIRDFVAACAKDTD